MENTLENNKKFFAQYWGQEVYMDCYTSKPFSVTSIHNTDAYLLLKPLSVITDEDSIYISNIVYGNDEVDKIEYGRKYILDYFIERSDEFTGYVLEEIIIITDYLRSKGYALTWMGLSVDKLQEYGWIKLKSE